MRVDPVAGDAKDDLDAQVAALREDVMCLSAQALQSAARVAHLEAALRLVRDLMRDLPAPDNVALVAVRLRKHFDNFAGDVIADALAVPPVDDVTKGPPL